MLLKKGTVIPSAKIQLCKCPVIPDTNYLLKLNFTSGYKDSNFIHGSFLHVFSLILIFFFLLIWVSFSRFGPSVGSQFSFVSLLCGRHTPNQNFWEYPLPHPLGFKQLFEVGYSLLSCRACVKAGYECCYEVIKGDHLFVS